MSAPESWKTAYRELIETITRMGYPEEFGRAIAKNLGSEKAMRRMTAYLYSAKPRSAEDIEDARFIADEASDNELEHIQKTMTESNDLKIVARMKAIQSLSNINIKNKEEKLLDADEKEREKIVKAIEKEKKKTKEKLEILEKKRHLTSSSSLQGLCLLEVI